MARYLVKHRELYLTFNNLDAAEDDCMDFLERF
jgi:hypothetical protein